MSRVRALSGLLVEEYLDGPELSVESIVADGVTTVCAITEKALAFAPYFEEVGHVTRGVDSLEALDAQLVALAGDAHAALGVTSGATHCEVRLTSDGPRVVEVGARVGGDRIPYLTRRATGVDLIVAAAAVATGGRPDTTPTASRFAGIRMVYPDRDGVVERIGIAPSATDLLDDVGWYARAGDRVALPPRGFLARLGYLVAVADTRAEVVRRLDAAEGLVDIAIGEPDVAAAAVGE
jgi:biotin carboxylase